jgi:hypothetical protein
VQSTLSKTRFPLWFAVLLCSAAIGAPREHGAHVHGEATLDVAVEGNKLDLHLDAPGASITGFEHPPVDTSESKLYNDSVATLRTPSKWLTPTAAAECTAKPGIVEAHGFDMASKSSGPIASPHAGASAAAEHEHSDFDVDVSFICRHPEKLAAIDVALFGRFPPLHKVIVNLALPTGQDRQELLPSGATVRLGK